MREMRSEANVSYKVCAFQEMFPRGGGQKICARERRRGNMRMGKRKENTSKNQSLRIILKLKI